MTLPALLAQRPRNQQVVFALLAPSVFGAIVGYFLAHSQGVYTALSVLAAVGGVLAGFDHQRALAGAKRGLLGGALYGTFVLIAHEIDGSSATTKLPDPAIVLVVATVVLGAALGALGGYMRSRAAGQPETT